MTFYVNLGRRMSIQNKRIGRRAIHFDASLLRKIVEFVRLIFGMLPDRFCPTFISTAQGYAGRRTMR